jgi:hypothetical protein
MPVLRCSGVVSIDVLLALDGIQTKSEQYLRSFQE